MIVCADTCTGGKNLEEAFGNAALAMSDYMSEIEAIEEKETKEISVTGVRLCAMFCSKARLAGRRAQSG